jgi:hypothetical protein
MSDQLLQSAAHVGHVSKLVKVSDQINVLFWHGSTFHGTCLGREDHVRYRTVEPKCQQSRI